MAAIGTSGPTNLEQTIQPVDIDLFGLTSDQVSVIIAYIVAAMVVIVILAMVYYMYCLPDDHPADGPHLERVVTTSIRPTRVPIEMAGPPMPRSPYSISMRELNDRESQRLMDVSTRSDRLDSFVDVPLTDHHLERFTLHDPLIRYQAPPGTPYHQYDKHQ